MTRATMLRRLLVPTVIAAVIGAAATVAYASSGHGNSLDRLRQATAPYRDVAVATRGHYDRLTDTAGIACIDMPGMGAMGTHYVNGELVGDGVLDPLAPEAMVYETDAKGALHLVAVEYIVFQSAWDAGHATAPALFGQSFDLTPTGNRFGLPAFYSLHAWVWKHNPAGIFSMWNPKVTCTPGQHHEHEHDGMNGSY